MQTYSIKDTFSCKFDYEINQSDQVYILVYQFIRIRSTRVNFSEMVNLDSILRQIKNNTSQLTLNFMKIQFKAIDDKFSGMLLSKNNEIDELKKTN